MLAGYSSRCKACNTPLRGQIEAWKEKDKLNTSQIELKLKELGEPISRRALDNHFAEHYDVQAEVREQYNKSQLNLVEDAGERVKEIVILDNIIEGRTRLHKALEEILSKRIADVGKQNKIDESDELPKIPGSYVALYNGCITGVCQAMKTKQELLGEDSGKKKADALQSWVDLMLEDE